MTGPIGVVFTPDTMNRYLMLFNTLWRAKRMEWVLSKVWKRLATLHKVNHHPTGLFFFAFGRKVTDSDPVGYRPLDSDPDTTLY